VAASGEKHHVAQGWRRSDTTAQRRLLGRSEEGEENSKRAAAQENKGPACSPQLMSNASFVKFIGPLLMPSNNSSADLVLLEMF
jgi:hypothetical protein